MEPLDQHSTTDAHTAKQDKIDIEIGDWIIAGDDSALSTLFFQMSRLPVRTLVRTDGTSDPTWFGRFQGFRYGKAKLSFTTPRRNVIRRAELPLIAGQLIGRRTGPWDDHAPTRFRITATLSINPTRFVRHRGRQSRTRNSISDWADQIDRTLLTSRQLPSKTRFETILDGNDNVLLSQRSREPARPEIWLDQVRLYWRNVIEFLNSNIEEAAVAQGLGISTPDFEFNARKIETYWEFATDDALDMVSQLTPAFQSLGRQFTSRLFPLGQIEEVQNANSMGIKVKLTEAVQCQLYAKTNKRVRLEFTHNLAVDAGHLLGGHTSSNFDDLLGMIERTAQDAAWRGEAVIAHIRTHLEHNTHQRPIYELVRRIVSASGSDDEADLILSHLVNTARIVSRGRDSLRPVINKLVSNEVLVQPRKYQTVFGIHPQYRNAIAEMRGMRRRRLQ